MNEQSTQASLDQIELMKQFIGSWQCECSKDTFLIIENTPFGSGMVSNCKIATKDEILDSIIQLYGYDREADRFIMTELIKSSAVLEICYIKFISRTKGEMVVTNTENAKYKWNFEFKTPDTIVQQAILDDNIAKEVTLKRVKSDP